MKNYRLLATGRCSTYISTSASRTDAPVKIVEITGKSLKVHVVRTVNESLDNNKTELKLACTQTMSGLTL
jgi:hypothetical protein